MTKILITGASSYIGTYLCKRFSELIQKRIISESEISVFGLYNGNPVDYKHIKMLKVNITDQANFENLFRSIKPNIVYHLASVTQTKTRYYNEEYINLVNHEITRRIARHTIRYKSSLIYLSTDLVYDEGINIREDSSPLKPLTIYADTKLSGEKKIVEIAREFIILRLSLVYGFSISSYKTFFDEVYEKLNKGETYYAFSDQYRCPISVTDVADNLIILAENKLPNAIVNLCGDELLSRLEMCNMIAEEFGFDKNLIQPVSCETFAEYKIVKKLGLNNEKMKSLGMKAREFKENLKLIVAGLNK